MEITVQTAINEVGLSPCPFTLLDTERRMGKVRVDLCYNSLVSALSWVLLLVDGWKGHHPSRVMAHACLQLPVFLKFASSRRWSCRYFQNPLCTILVIYGSRVYMQVNPGPPLYSRYSTILLLASASTSFDVTLENNLQQGVVSVNMTKQIYIITGKQLIHLHNYTKIFTGTQIHIFT